MRACMQMRTCSHTHTQTSLSPSACDELPAISYSHNLLESRLYNRASMKAYTAGLNLFRKMVLVEPWARRDPGRCCRQRWQLVPCLSLHRQYTADSKHRRHSSSRNNGTPDYNKRLG